MLVPFEVQSPCLLPPNLQTHGALLQVCGAERHVVPGAIEKGIWLSRAQLESLQKAEGFHVEVPPNQMAKKNEKGRLLKEKVYKKDLAKSCIRHYFKDLDPEGEAFTFMYESIMGTKVATIDESVLAAIDVLDPIEQQDFDDMKQVAKNQRKAQENATHEKKKKTVTSPKPDEGEEEECGPTCSSASGVKRPPAPPASDDEAAAKVLRSSSVGNYEKKVYTPASLHELLPGKGHLAGVYIKRLPNTAASLVMEETPKKSRAAGCYQGFYPGKVGCS